MNKTPSSIEGCFTIDLKKLEDYRGSFVKTFASSVFKELVIDFSSREEYYSVSKKNVFRGFHFQIPPHDHDKIVYCAQGHVLDMIIDLRKKSPTFRKIITVDLDSSNPRLVFIPKGCAHGFFSFDDESVVIYRVTSEYHPSSDKGISYKSVSVPWPVSETDLIISERDQKFPLLNDFDNPF